MITIQLDEHSAENIKAVQILKNLGMNDNEIQKYVDRQSVIDKEIANGVGD